jgi:hypothetical protein
MNAERIGIYVSIIVLVGVLGVAAVSSGDFDIGIGEIKIPQINAGTNTDTSKYAYYEWCYAMGKADC